MLKEVLPDWNVTFFEAHADPVVQQIEYHRDWVRTADLVLCQPIHDGYRDMEELSTTWIRENVRPGGAFLVVPSVHFTGHQVGLDELPVDGLPLFSNILAAHLMGQGCTSDEAVSMLTSEDFLTSQEIESEIRLSLEETERRELADKIDLPISPFLREHCRVRTLFHTYNHPLRETMVYIINCLLDRLGASERVTVSGHDYQPVPNVPPMPAVARFFREHGGGVAADAASTIVAMPGDPPETQAAYFSRMTNRLGAVPRDALNDLISKRWPAIQVLRRLAAQGSSIPGIARWAEG